MNNCLDRVDEKRIGYPEIICKDTSKSKGPVESQGKSGIQPEQTKVQIQTKLLETE